MTDTELQEHPASELDERQKIDAAIECALHGHRRLPEFYAPESSLASSEHLATGNLVKALRPEQFAEVQPELIYSTIRVSDKFTLTYGQIVALAGDLYGVPERPISGGRTLEEQQARFVEAYKTLVNADVNELNDILDVMRHEAREVTKAMERGEDAVTAFHHTDWDMKYAYATGFKVDTDDLSKSTLGRYLKLASANFDHFGKDAVTAYTAGHGAAIKTAIQARRKLEANVGPNAALEAEHMYQQALAMCAFADHYLTDLFSSGHLRVPRRALDYWDGIRGYWLAGGLMAKRQHNEDGNFGLFVRDSRHVRWQCFGDEHLNTFPGRDNKLRAVLAIQKSVSEVADAFNTGMAPTAYGALLGIPNLDQIAQTEEKMTQPDNHAALFIERNGDVCYRYPRGAVDTHHWEELTSFLYPWESGEHDSAATEVKEAAKGFIAGGSPPLPPPPHSTLKAPEAPKLDHWEKAGWQVPNQPESVQYALAYAVRRTFADGSACDYYSPLSKWCQPILRRKGESPAIEIPIIPVEGVTRRYLVRKWAGKAPNFDRPDFTHEGPDVMVVDGNQTGMITDEQV